MNVFCFALTLVIMNEHYKNRVQRLLKIVVEVKTAPRQTVSALIQNLGISKSQFYKDKGLLAEIGFSFEYSRPLKRFVIIGDAALPVENLTLTEQLSLVMALRHLSAAGDHILTYEGFKAAKKISTQLPQPLREHLFDDLVAREGFGCDADVMEKFQQAITDNWRVNFTYQRPELAEPTKEVLDPYHLFFKRRAIYVEGFSWNERSIRMYRLNRVKKIEFETKGFAVNEGYDFGKRYRNAFSAFPGEETETVIVRFSAKVRPFIEESLWHHSQRIIEEMDGAIRFQVEVAEPREVMWWAFCWGAEAEILEPEWLRKDASEAVSRMIAIYKRKHQAV